MSTTAGTSNDRRPGRTCAISAPTPYPCVRQLGNVRIVKCSGPTFVILGPIRVDTATRTVNRAFQSTELDVLLPGWGLRPGDVTQAVDAHLSAEAVAALGDSLSAAIDWARQVDALGRSRLPVVLTTTWLDAPSYGTAPRDLAPVEYLVQLAAPWSLPVTGENTGGSSSAALHRIVDQAARLGLTRVTWMSAASLAVGPVTLTELAAAAGLAWPGLAVAVLRARPAVDERRHPPTRGVATTL
jgi:hypothetical protein